MISTAFAAGGEAGKGLSIHLAPEVVTTVWGIPITNTIITSWVVVGIVLVAAFLFRNAYRLSPSRGQVVVETAVGGALDYMSNTLESPHIARRIFPFVMTIFIFILSLNWFGLLPGVTSIGLYEVHDGVKSFVPVLYPANTDLNITLAFAIIALIVIEVVGVAALGFFAYAGKFITFKSPLAFVIGIIELIGEIARLISFSFRLFGNIFAGKTLLVVAMFFVPFILPVPILAFELFVGFIQALVFAVLTLVFVKLAITEHGDAH